MTKEVYRVSNRTGAVVVHLVETSPLIVSGGNRFEADVPGLADPAANVIYFTTPVLDVAPANLAVSVSLDGGRTFSAPCSRRLFVRRRPVPRAVTPKWASAAGGTQIVVHGEYLRPEPLGQQVWIRFECGGVLKRARASPINDAGDAFRDFDLGELDGPYEVDFSSIAVPGEDGWTCTLPRMLECGHSAAAGAGPGGGLTVNVSISLDGGTTWLPSPIAAKTDSSGRGTARGGSRAKSQAGGRSEGGLTLTVHAPLQLQAPQPARIWRGGSVELTVGGFGLFRTPCAAIRISPLKGQATLPSSGSLADAQAETVPCACSPVPARLSSRPALAIITPPLNFVGEAVVEVSSFCTLRTMVLSIR